ncbi:MAG: AraC family ligand binding domain-containing protein, partial [Tissierellia bacterium]|nr:AraC family ligand binding domain-containing protein [Tissierellia bacterium]
MTKDLIRMNYKEMNTLDEGLTEHFHQGYEIIFITEGKARFIVNDEPGIYSKNSVVFINNLVKHRMSLEQVPYSRYMIIIDSSFFNDFIQIPEIHLLFKSKQQNFQNGVLIEPEDMAYVKDKIVHLQNIYDQKKHYWKYEFIANLFSLLIFIIREYPQNFPTQTIDRNTLLMIRIQQFIDSHFRSDITLEKLADEFFMSKYHL